MSILLRYGLLFQGEVESVNINVSDPITITDVDTVDNSTVPLVTSDTVQVLEDISTIVSDLSISVISSVTVVDVDSVDRVENVVNIELKEDKGESVVVNESISAEIPIAVIVLDTVSVIDYPTVSVAVIGSIVWGHDTGVTESIIKNFQDNWTGDGIISGSGDDEIITLSSGQAEESENFQLGTGYVVISINKYKSGAGSIIKKYKTAPNEAGLVTEEWAVYTDQFYCEGWAKIRAEAA